MRANPQEPSADPATPARCPRCGYDLRGTVASWAETCPLQGQCTECGLEFSWAHVLCPGKFEPPWCVEFSPRWRLPLASASTFLRALVPWRFWSALRMSMPLRPLRMVCHAALVLAAACLFAYVVVQGGSAARLRYLWQSGGTRQIAMMYGIRNPIPAATMQLPSHSHVVLDALLYPASDVFPVNPGPGMLPYPGSLYLHATLDMLGGPVVVTDDTLDYTSSVLLAGMWLCLMMPVGFVMLPVSRRRARVRWSHLARVAVHGVAVPAALIVAATLLAGAGLALGSRWLVRVAYVVLWFGTLPAVVCWWAVAIGRYLHIRHGVAVAVLLGIVIILLPPAVIIVVGLAVRLF